MELVIRGPAWRDLAVDMMSFETIANILAIILIAILTAVYWYARRHFEGEG